MFIVLVKDDLRKGYVYSSKQNKGNKNKNLINNMYGCLSNSHPINKYFLLKTGFTKLLTTINIKRIMYNKDVYLVKQIWRMLRIHNLL